MPLRHHKDFDDISCDLKKDDVRFNYGMLEDKGGFLSVQDKKPACPPAARIKETNNSKVKKKKGRRKDGV